MGASVSVTIGGVGTVADTGSGWWFWKRRARGATYSFSWSLTADTNWTNIGTMPAAPPNPTKFTPGPPIAGKVWPPNFQKVTGGIGSTANCSQGGSSWIGFGGVWNDYNVATGVSAMAAAAPSGNASATSDVVDPWEVEAWPQVGLPLYMMATATPEAMLVPSAGGASGLALYGSFGRIDFGLAGQNNSPSCKVQLEPGWQVFADLAFPSHGGPMAPPSTPLTPDALQKLFLDQHDPAHTVWCWRRSPPALTFVKPFPAGAKTELLEVCASASDDDAQPGDDRRRK